VAHSPIQIETHRLILREWKESDAAFLLELNSNPEVVKYTGDPPFKSLTAATKFIQAYDHYEKHGYGRWLCVLKENSIPIGWCGLKWDEHEELIDLGYRFLQSHWNQGFATEAGLASLVVGFTHFHMKEIICRAMELNLPSFRVMEKMGFKYLKHGQCALHDARYYRLGREEFEVFWPHESWSSKVTYSLST
jgi:[ribosomal protein S5]-alanine N-acetyltransferase